MSSLRLAGQSEFCCGTSPVPRVGVCTIVQVLINDGGSYMHNQKKVLTCMQEAGTGFASKPQTDDAEPGDIALDSWVRYDIASVIEHNNY